MHEIQTISLMSNICRPVIQTICTMSKVMLKNYSKCHCILALRISRLGRLEGKNIILLVYKGHILIGPILSYFKLNKKFSMSLKTDVCISKDESIIY